MNYTILLQVANAAYMDAPDNETAHHCNIIRNIVDAMKEAAQKRNESPIHDLVDAACKERGCTPLETALIHDVFFFLMNHGMTKLDALRQAFLDVKCNFN